MDVIPDVELCAFEIADGQIVAEGARGEFFPDLL
jgi:hypothetical protein